MPDNNLAIVILAAGTGSPFVTTDTAFSQNTVEFTRLPASNAFRFTGRVPLNADPDDYVVTSLEFDEFAFRFTGLPQDLHQGFPYFR